VLALAVGGCKRQPVDDPEPPPAAIYIDPATSPPEGAGDPADHASSTGPPRDDPGQTGGVGPATAGDVDPDAPADDIPDFRDTLEEMPGKSPERGRDGLPAAGTCEGGARTAGERWKVKCNTCTCQADGEVTCTLMACFGDD
jgi:hypothetical protein